MLGGVDVGHGAAAGHVGHPVHQELPPGDQDTRRARPADELVRAQEHRVLVGQRLQAGAVHLDVDVRPSSGEIPERECAVAVEQHRDAVGVTDDAGDIARRGERPDLQWSGGVPGKFVLQRADVYMAVGVLPDDHDISDRLPPRQLIGVMLERPDEDHRPVTGRDPGAELVAVIELGGDPQAQDADQFVDRTGTSRPGEDHHRLCVAADRGTDDAQGVLTQPARLQAGATGFGVGVGVAGQHLAPDEVLQEAQRPA